jgi:hypothetical protein
MEDGGFGNDAMGFDPFGPEEEQGADQRRDGSLERYQLAAASFEDEKNQSEDQAEDENFVPYGFKGEAAVTEKDNLVDVPFGAWEWGRSNGTGNTDEMGAQNSRFSTQLLRSRFDFDDGRHESFDRR